MYVRYADVGAEERAQGRIGVCVIVRRKQMTQRRQIHILRSAMSSCCNIARKPHGDVWEVLQHEIADLESQGRWVVLVLLIEPECLT